MKTRHLSHAPQTKPENTSASNAPFIWLHRAGLYVRDRAAYRKRDATSETDAPRLQGTLATYTVPHSVTHKQDERQGSG